jgi:hypothetical protein
MTAESAWCSRCLAARAVGASVSPSRHRPCLPEGIRRLSNVLMVLSAIALVVFAPWVRGDWWQGMVALGALLALTLAVALRRLHLFAYWLLLPLLCLLLWTVGKQVRWTGLGWWSLWTGDAVVLCLLPGVLFFYLLGHCGIFHAAVAAETARRHQVGDEVERRLWGRALGWATGVQVAALIAWGLTPTMQEWMEERRTVACKNHLRQIGLALIQYLNDYDGRYPLANRPLPVSLKPYAAGAGVFRCPKDANFPGSSYRLNPELSGQIAEKVVEREKTILVSEGGLRETPVRHRDGAHYLLADLRAELLSQPSWLTDYKWIASQRITRAKVEAIVYEWEQAWEGKDVKRLERLYPPDYKGEAQSHARWVAGKRISFARWQTINVTVRDMTTTLLNDEEAQGEFQRTFWSYSANPYRSYEDRGRKTLLFKKVGDQALITEERFVQEYVNRYPK